MTNPAIATIYGIVGSALFNISKGMQRQGIDAVASLFPGKRGRPEGKRRPRSAKHVALYATGFVLNNSLGFFAILANRYAPSSYFTSMFGLGIIALMLYARFVLKEPLHPFQYAGAVVLALGTLILGYDGIVREKMTMARIHLPTAGIVIGASLLLGMVILICAHRTRSLLVLGAVFGLVIGFVASLDPILKGIGQNFGQGERFLPSRSLGWIIFLASFIFATLSFIASQWIFSRGVRASVLVPSQNFAYIVFPIVLQAISLPGFNVSGLTASGLIITSLGIFVMQAKIQRG